MDDIQIQLERLKSSDKNTRFDACEMLRVADSLTPEALDALRVATDDPDRLVAEAARDALSVHTQPPAAIPMLEVGAVRPKGFWDSPGKKLWAVGLLFAAAFVVLSAWRSTHWGSSAGLLDLIIFPGWCYPIALAQGDYVGWEAPIAGWMVYLFGTFFIAISPGRVAKALYIGLVLLVLFNLVNLVFFPLFI